MKEQENIEQDRKHYMKIKMCSSVGSVVYILPSFQVSQQEPVVQLVNSLDWQWRGRGFEPCHPQRKNELFRML